MYERTILGFVGVALGAEADHGGVFLVRDDAHDAVRGHRVLVQHERDGLFFFYGVGVYLLYIDQRAGVIGRLHRAGQHGEYLQSHDPRANQQERQENHQRDPRMLLITFQIFLRDLFIKLLTYPLPLKLRL